MAKSTPPMLILTGISFGNQWLGNGDLDLRILIGGLVATGALALVEQVPGLSPLASGIAWVALITLLFTRLDGKASPIDNISKLTGF
jgi:hypothetical protein